MKRNLGYTFGKTRENDEIEYQELVKRLAEEEKQRANSPVAAPIQPTQRQPQTPPIVTAPSQTNLPFWTIPDVSYRGVRGNVDVLNGLLEGGSSKTQNDWAAYSEQERSAGNFYTPDYPLLYATLNRAFDLKDDSAQKQTVGEVRLKLKEIARANWIMTLTRIAYAPRGKDTIIHNFGLKEKYDLTEKFVGADGELPAGSPESLYQKLLGTSDNLAKIKGVFNWMNDTNSVYMWRVNSKPKKLDERVARFSADSVRAGFDCFRSPTYSSTSFGVRFASTS